MSSLLSVPASLIYRPADWLEPTPWAVIFGREAPVEVDIGAGKGAFLLAAAAAAPDRNFLGIERQLVRVRKVDAKARRRGLTNVRLVRVEAGYFVRYLVPAGSVAVYHIYCPDPWPKRRHRQRRLISPAFVADLHRTLEPRGWIKFSTDDRDYFEAAESVFRASGRFCERPAGVPPPGLVTDFERMFSQQGLVIHRAQWQKQ
jgi:tRNA (guanine-N7-)-methyltransferase